MWIFSQLKNRSKLVRKRALHRARIFLKYLVDRRSKEPIFVLTTHRSGSNLLISYLNSVPGVWLANEVLHPSMAYGIRWWGISKRAVLRHIAHSLCASSGRLSGVKMIISRMNHHRISPSDLVRLFPTARFIVLYRRSLLDQFISHQIAERTHVWQSLEKSQSVVDGIAVSPGEFQAYCARIRSKYESVLERLPARSIFITYEELALDPQALFNRKLFPFLGLPVSRVSTALKRQNLKSPDQVISNFKDLQPFLRAEETFQEYGLDLQKASVA